MGTRVIRLSPRNLFPVRDGMGSPYTSLPGFNHCSLMSPVVAADSSCAGTMRVLPRDSLWKHQNHLLTLVGGGTSSMTGRSPTGAENRRRDTACRDGDPDDVFF